MSVPLDEYAERMGWPLDTSVSAVVVSKLPLISMRPTTRCTVAEVDELVPATPPDWLYPIRMKYLPSPEAVMAPSVFCVPENVKAKLPVPLVRWTLGNWID